MPHLVRQRIKYLVEYGELYPVSESITKNFIAKAVGLIVLVDLLSLGVHLWLTVR